MSLLIGWVPLLGPLALGFVAARAERGLRAPLVLLPALLFGALGLILARALALAAQRAVIYGVHLEGWLWTAVGWLLSPVGTLLGRPFSHLLVGTPPAGLLLLYGAPVLVGLLLGALGPRRGR